MSAALKPRLRYDYSHGWWRVPGDPDLLARLVILAKTSFQSGERHAKDLGRRNQASNQLNELLALEAALWDSVLTVATGGLVSGLFSGRYHALVAAVGLPDRLAQSRWPA